MFTEGKLEKARQKALKLGLAQTGQKLGEAIAAFKRMKDKSEEAHPRVRAGLAAKAITEAGEALAGEVHIVKADIPGYGGLLQNRTSRIINSAWFGSAMGFVTYVALGYLDSFKENRMNWAFAAGAAFTAVANFAQSVAEKIKKPKAVALNYISDVINDVTQIMEQKTKL